MLALAGIWRCHAYGYKMTQVEAPAVFPVALCPELEAKEIFARHSQSPAPVGESLLQGEEQPVFGAAAFFLRPFVGHWVLSSVGATGCAQRPSFCNSVGKQPLLGQCGRPSFFG